jgi:hypothetical protein
MILILEEAMGLARLAAFRENPVGMYFDPEELVPRMRSGGDEGSIKKRVEVGAREFPSLAPTTA